MKHKEFPVIVYSSESVLRSPRTLVWKMFSDLLDSRELAWRLLIRNLQAQYRQSLLGFFWAFVPAIVTTATWVFLRSSNVINVKAEEGVPYAVYVFTGIILWQTFVESLNSSMKYVKQSRGMLAKINFPKEALVLAGAGEVVFNLMVKLTLLVATFAIYGIALSPYMFLFPVGLLSIIILGHGIGLLLTPLGILYGDVSKAIVSITTFWFFFTPVVYSPPTSWPAKLITDVNPISPLLIASRKWLLGGHSGDLSSFVVISCGGILLLIFAWLLYKISMPHLIGRTSS